MPQARIELLQSMPIFGGVRANILQFLLGLCPVESVPKNEFFFREGDQADSMFVLEAGKAAVLKSWRGQDCLLRTLKQWISVRAAPPSVPSNTAPRSVFRPPTSTKCIRRILSSSR